MRPFFRVPCTLVLLLLLAACAGDGTSEQIAGSSSYRPITIRNGIELPPSAHDLSNIAPAAGNQTDTPQALLDTAPSSHCSLRDRFDRKHFIAYKFADGRSRMGLQVDADGFGLSDFGSIEVETIKLNFRYRFQAIPKKQEKCLYQSGWQGLVGSAYNEFFLREDQTVYEAIDDELDHVEDELSRYF